jgi:hypothetical protein
VTSFYSARPVEQDWRLFRLAQFSPDLFRMFVRLRFPEKMRAIGLLPRIPRQLPPPPPLDSFEECAIVTVTPHMRERTMVSRFGKRIKQAVILNSVGRDVFSQSGIPVRYHNGDWIDAWLLLFQLWKPGRLLIVSGISDFWMMPLKVHPLTDFIVFDSYDPLGEYATDANTRRVTALNYQLGKNYFLRDGRFRHALRQSGNVTARQLYLPDVPQFSTLTTAELKQKFADVATIRFACAGWSTAEGDGAILRSLRLVKKLWPNSEIHFCLTQFMRPDNPEFASLFEFIATNEGCVLHHDLQGKAYTDVLDRAHVGINLHDPNVFGEGYKVFDKKMIQRCASARVLDFAVRGCILMTTRDHVYGRSQFVRFSPHRHMFYLSQSSASGELLAMIDALHIGASSSRLG